MGNDIEKSNTVTETETKPKEDNAFILKVGAILWAIAGVIGLLNLPKILADKPAKTATPDNQPTLVLPPEHH